MGYRYESKVETERKADADAFTTWLAEVANGELKAPVEGRDRVREKQTPTTSIQLIANIPFFPYFCSTSEAKKSRTLSSSSAGISC